MKRLGRGGKFGLASAGVGVAFAVAGLLLFIPSAGAANIVQAQSPGYIRARGAVAEVTVMVVCRLQHRYEVGSASTPARATLTVALTERVGKHVTGGTGKAGSRAGDFRCDGNSHLVTIAVPAKTGARAFAKGGTFAQTTLKVCTPTCRTVTDQRTIRLR